MLKIAPISIKKANEYVKENHRHHGSVAGAKFAIAIVDTSEAIRGVALVGRPVARRLDDGLTLEVNRCCTDGVKNGCSMLYGAAWRIAREMGYKKIITYTLQQETGASLRAVGWAWLGKRKQGNWNVPSRPRKDSPLLGDKYLWGIVSQGMKVAHDPH